MYEVYEFSDIFLRVSSYISISHVIFSTNSNWNQGHRAAMPIKLNLISSKIDMKKFLSSLSIIVLNKEISMNAQNLSSYSE